MIRLVGAQRYQTLVYDLRDTIGRIVARARRVVDENGSGRSIKSIGLTQLIRGKQNNSTQLRTTETMAAR